MPLEVFVHGALCVAYSGPVPDQRIARRPQRQPRPVCPGLPAAVRPHLRRPRRRSGRAEVPAQPAGPGRLSTWCRELIDAGVCSFKIEGRLKTPEYVANITRHYRQAIDAAWPAGRLDFTPRDVEEMELSFSRGFSPGWLDGCDHKMLVPGAQLGQARRAAGRRRRQCAASASLVAAGGSRRRTGRRRRRSTATASSRRRARRPRL